MGRADKTYNFFHRYCRLFSGFVADLTGSYGNPKRRNLHRTVLSRRALLASLSSAALVRPSLATAIQRSSLAEGIAPIPFLKGINFSGLSFRPGSQWPVTFAVDYFCGRKGMNAVRLCWEWELAQPVLNGPLNLPQIKGIQDQIDRIAAAGGWVILELHNYGRRTEGEKVYIVGETPTVTSAHFADVWGKIAAQWKDSDRVIFELSNEPHDQDTKILVRVSNDAIAAIRQAGARNMIMICANHWNSYGWRSGSDNLTLMPGIVDPLDNTVFDVHHYFDDWSAGQTPKVTSDWMVGLRSFTDWARAHGKRGFCGEFGTPVSDEGTAALRTFLTFLKDNDDVWIGWTWWGGGGWWTYDYLFRLDPFGSPYDEKNPFAQRAKDWSPPQIDMPQMTVLDEFLPIKPPTNFVRKSRAFDAVLRGGGPWQHLNCRVEMKAADGVFGARSATGIRGAGRAGTRYGLAQSMKNIPPDTALTMSAVVKAEFQSLVELSLVSHGNELRATFDLRAGRPVGVPVGTAVKTAMQPLGAGYYLLALSGNIEVHAGEVTAQLLFNARGVAEEGAANISTISSGYIDHLQLETGVVASPPKINT